MRPLLTHERVAASAGAFLYGLLGPERRKIGTQIATLVAVEGRRWRIEDAFETAKTELGLDHNETRSWHGWHRHVSLVMMASALLAVIRHHANAPPPKRKTRTPRRGPCSAGPSRKSAHRCAAGAAAHPTRSGRRMVALAAGPPGRRSPNPSQTTDRRRQTGAAPKATQGQPSFYSIKNATVMLGILCAYGKRRRSRSGGEGAVPKELFFVETSSTSAAASLRRRQGRRSPLPACGKRGMPGTQGDQRILQCGLKSG